jgi:membrane fusion protein (multidrug efflux system)
LLKTSSVSEQEAAEKKADLELKSATVEAAHANVRRLEELQSFERVTAPFAGTITARGTDVGQLVAASSGNELFRLAQTGTLRVFVRVPQAVAHGMAPGQMAELTIPELPGRVFPGQSGADFRGHERRFAHVARGAGGGQFARRNPGRHLRPGAPGGR